MSALALAALVVVQSPDSIAAYLAQHQRPAVEALVEAARTHRVLILGDVHPAAAPKRLLADLLRVLRSRGLIDAVALEVPMTQQPAIREYLASSPEDIEILLAHPLLLRSHWGESREYLEIYRTVWDLNREASAGRRVEILAIDAPRGPPAVTSRRAALERYVNRDAVMELRIRHWRESHIGGRILVFVGDLHTLKGVEANLDAEGEFSRLVPLASRLERLWPSEVFAALSDASVAGHEAGASRVFPLARAALGGVPGVPGGVAVPPAGPLDRLPSPIRFDLSQSSLTIELLPRSYTLGRVTDLYLFFGTSDPLTPLDGEWP